MLFSCNKPWSRHNTFLLTYMCNSQILQRFVCADILMCFDSKSRGLAVNCNTNSQLAVSSRNKKESKENE